MTKLKKMRVNRGIKQKELAVLLKLDQSTVSIQERDGIRSTGSARRYAKALDCEPLDVMEV